MDHPIWIETACTYAETCNWKVFPVHMTYPKTNLCTCGLRDCTIPGGHPRFPNWQYEATDVIQNIVAWGDLYPESNLAVETGARSGIVALRITATDSMSGRESIDWLQRRYGNLPDTPYYKNGNEEVFFLKYPGFRVPHYSSIRENIQLIGDEYYVVIPHSFKNDHRSGMRWIIQPTLDPPKLAPRWLYRRAGLYVPDTYEKKCERENTKKQPSLFQTADHLLTNANENHPWIVKPWAASGSITLLLGAPKISGKTTWLIHLAQSVLSGSLFLNETCHVSPVVYLSENSPHILRALLQNTGVPNTVDNANLSLLFAESVRSYGWNEIVRMAIQQCSDVSARLLIVDSIDLFAALDTHEKGINTPGILGPLLDARDRGIGVIVVSRRYNVGSTLNTFVNELGEIATIADVLMHIKPAGLNTTKRMIEALSSFNETPYISYIDYKNGQYLRVGDPALPLFQQDELYHPGPAKQTIIGRA